MCNSKIAITTCNDQRCSIRTLTVAKLFITTVIILYILGRERGNTALTKEWTNRRMDSQ